MSTAAERNRDTEQIEKGALGKNEVFIRQYIEDHLPKNVRLATEQTLQEEGFNLHSTFDVRDGKSSLKKRNKAKHKLAALQPPKTRKGRSENKKNGNAVSVHGRRSGAVPAAGR